MEAKPAAFTFDSVANELVTQENFYNQNVRGLVQELIQGQSATILCYGPTK